MTAFKLTWLVFLILLLSYAVKGQLFTVNCRALTVQRSDPIISPGIASSHVHAVSGGTAFQRTMSAITAVDGRATTCDKVLDRSDYWVPQLYHLRSDGKFEIITFQGSATYYLNRACNYEPGLATCGHSEIAAAPPAGLRMVAGDPTLRTYNASSFAQKAINHMCLQEKTSTQFSSLPPELCIRLRAEVFFPSCWDGVNLDSANHKDHMAYPAVGDYNFGVCPQSHPVAIFSIFYEFFFDTSQITNFNKYVYSMGDPTGYGLHGDFINGWTDQIALQDAFPSCVGPDGFKARNCSLVVDGSAGSSSKQPLDVAAPVENVGLTGPIAALPGNNPITGIPIKRSRVRRGSI